MRKWYDQFSCEVPKSDANRLFMSIKEMLKFMRDGGAENISYDDKSDCWRCIDPEWVAGRKLYSDMVQRQCELYGCE
jgi:hypothetical protein